MADSGNSTTSPKPLIQPGVLIQDEANLKNRGFIEGCNTWLARLNGLL